MTSIEADYLIVGTGAAGMAFADALLTDTNARIVMVDRRDRPGGHWNDAPIHLCVCTSLRLTMASTRAS